MGPHTLRKLLELANKDAASIFKTAKLGDTELDETDLARLHAPVGLDIGANTSAEIALSIVAEMRAVLDARRGGMLRECRGSIHGGRGVDQRLHITEERIHSVAA